MSYWSARSRIFFAAMLLLGYLFAFSEAQLAVYHVSTLGTDTANDCLSGGGALACATLQNALSSATTQAGFGGPREALILIEPGKYSSGYVGYNTSGYETWHVDNMTIQRDDSVPGGEVLLEIGGALLYDEANYTNVRSVTFRGLHVVFTGLNATINWSIMYVNGFLDVSIENCVLESMDPTLPYEYSIFIGGAKSFTMKDSLVHNFAGHQNLFVVYLNDSMNNESAVNLMNVTFEDITLREISASEPRSGVIIVYSKQSVSVDILITNCLLRRINISKEGMISLVFHFEISILNEFLVNGLDLTEIRSDFLILGFEIAREAHIQGVAIQNCEIDKRFGFILLEDTSDPDACLLTLSDIYVDCGDSQGVFGVNAMFDHAMISNVTIQNCRGSYGELESEAGVYINAYAADLSYTSMLQVSGVSISNSSLVDASDSKKISSSTFSFYAYVEMSDSRFEDIQTPSGAVLFYHVYSVAIDGLLVARNNVSDFLGAMFFSCVTELNVSNSIFEDNVGKGGSAISVINDFGCASNTSYFNLIDSRFSRNKGDIASAVFVEGGLSHKHVVWVEGSLFEENEVESIGTFIFSCYSLNSTVDFVRTRFIGNKQWADTPSLSSPTLSDRFLFEVPTVMLDFDWNAMKAVDSELSGVSAGIIAIDYAKVAISDSIFEGNEARGRLNGGKAVGGSAGAVMAINVLFVEISNVSFVQNVANQFASALFIVYDVYFEIIYPGIYVEGYFLISDSILSDNVATEVGALGLYDSSVGINRSSAYIERTVFSNNSALDALGGSIFAVFDVIEIVDCSFSSSVAFGGGAIAIIGDESSISSILKTQANISIVNSSFSDCRGIAGGAIMMYNEGNATHSLDISGCTFRENEASILGGAVLVSDSRMMDIFTMRDCIFEGNVEIVRNLTEQSNTTGSGNFFGIDFSDIMDYFEKLGEVSGEGGSISVLVVRSFTVENSVFLDNAAEGQNSTAGFGGAIFAGECFLISMKNNTFKNNTASGMGGAVFLSAIAADSLANDILSKYGLVMPTDWRIEMGNLSVIGNNASLGGGFFILQSESAVANLTVEILGSNFTGNEAEGGFGGGLSILMSGENSAVAVNDTLFSVNGAKFGGGGLFANVIGENNSVEISECDFTKNYAAGGGGAAAFVNTTGPGHRISFTDSNFEENALSSFREDDSFSITYGFMDASISLNFQNILQGGALFFLEGRSTTGVVTTVMGNSLSRNSAWQGGSIAINTEAKDSLFVVDSNLFQGLGDVDCEAIANTTGTLSGTGNFVRSGGVLSVVAPGYSELDIMNNLFYNSHVLISGGAIYARDDVKSRMWNNTFRNVSACFHGGIITCIDVKGFDSRGNTYWFRDRDNSTIVSVSRGRFSSDSDTIEVDSSGCIIYDLDFVEALSISNISLKCAKGEWFGETKSYYWDDYENTTLYFYRISCDSCPRYMYSLERGSIEQANASYGFDSTTDSGLYPVSTAVKCYECPYGASSCEGGSDVRASPRFWGNRDRTGKIAFDICPENYCCEQGGGRCKYNECYGNRAGVLCGKCAEGYAEVLGSSTRCVPVEECDIMNGVFYFLMIFLVAVVYACVLLSLGGGGKGTFKVLTYFLQVVGFVSPYFTPFLVTWILNIPSMLVNLEFSSVLPYSVSESITGGVGSGGCAVEWLTPAMKLWLAYLGPILLATMLTIFGTFLILLKLFFEIAMKISSKFGIYEWLFESLLVGKEKIGKRSTMEMESKVVKVGGGAKMREDSEVGSEYDSSESSEMEDSSDSSDSSDSEEEETTDSNTSTSYSSEDEDEDEDEDRIFFKRGKPPLKAFMSFFEKQEPFAREDFSMRGNMVWRVTAAATNASLVSYSILMNATLALLHCELLSDGEARFFLSAETICPTLWQGPLLLFLWFVLIPFPLLLIPLRYLCRTKWLRKTSVAKAVISVLESPYRERMRWWETVLMLRRLVIISIDSFIPDPFVGSFLISAACAVVLLLELFFNPFADKMVGLIEKTSLFMLLLLSMFRIREGTMISSGVVDNEETSQPLISWAFLSLSFFARGLIALLIVMYMLYSTLLLLGLKNWLRRIIQLPIFEIFGFSFGSSKLAFKDDEFLDDDDDFDDFDDDDDDDDDDDFFD